MRKSISAIVAAVAASLILPAAAFAYWPVVNGHAYISQGYSPRHRAYDIASDAGTRVVPVRSGKVVFAGRKHNCGGIQVWVSHGDGLYSAYFHLRSEAVSRGQRVTSQQTTIGRVGETGCATGPHVHVEIWHGKPWTSGAYRVNPWRFIDSGTWLPLRYR